MMEIVTWVLCNLSFVLLILSTIALVWYVHTARVTRSLISFCGIIIAAAGMYL